MKLGKETKHNAQIIIISVLILTLITLAFSYSAFFSVKTPTTFKEISTGTLNVLIDTSSAAMNTNDLLPTSDLPTDDNPNVNDSYAKLVLKNTGSLDAEFVITIGYDYENLSKNGHKTSELVNLDYINLGLYDETKHGWVDFSEDGGHQYYIPITAFTPTDESYPVLRDFIDHSDSKEYRVYIWLSEDTPTTEVGKLVYLKLEVQSATINGRIDEIVEGA